MGVLIGLATALMTFVKFSLPYMPPFLKYDPSEVFALVGGLIYGPVVGVTIVALKNVMHMIVSGNFTIVSHIANFVAGGTLVFVSALFYPRFKGTRYTWVAFALGCVAMALVMIPSNYLVFLPYHGILGERAREMAIFTITPFNFAKAAISSVIGYVLFLRVTPFLVATRANGTSPRTAPLP
jgi:riboflavin transporter FmnP